MTDNWEMHAIIVHKGPNMTLKKADKIASDIMKGPTKFMRETGETKNEGSYRYRVIPKTKFKKFRTQPINKDVSIVWGVLK